MMGKKVENIKNNNNACSFCKKDFEKEKKIFKFVDSINIVKDIYHIRCFNKKKSRKYRNYLKKDRKMNRCCG